MQAPIAQLANAEDAKVCATTPLRPGIGLSAFARLNPRLARHLIGRSIAPDAFGNALWNNLDHAVRSPTVTRELLRVVTAFNKIKIADQWEFFVDCLTVDSAIATQRRIVSRSLRSLWGTTPILNIIPCSNADRLLGIHSESVVITTYYITSKFDVVLKNHEAWFTINALHAWERYRWVLLTWALLSYDIFHYFNDQGLLPAGGYGSNRFGINEEEMRLIRRSGKVLYSMAYGADFRSRDKTFKAGSYNLCMECPEIGKFCICSDKDAEKVLGTIGVYANAMLGAGLSLTQLPNARCLDYLIVDVNQFPRARSRPQKGKPLIIAHIPNHPQFKGTKYLESSISVLRSQNVPIELRMITGVSNVEALQLMRDADIVADQFISGSFGYTAIEAMALGKPVLCFIRDDVTLPDRNHLPIINANPDTLYETLKKLADDRSALSGIGRRSREYVEVNYSIEAFALRLRQLYLDTSPIGALFETAPKSVRVHEARITKIARARQFYSIRNAFRVLSTSLVGYFSRAKHAASRSPAAIRRKLNTSLMKALSGLSRVKRIAIRCIREPGFAKEKTRYVAAITAKKTLLIFLSIQAPLPIKLARATTRARLWYGIPRTLWGVTPILTLPQLAQCDRLLGLRSNSLVFTTYHTTSNFDINLKRIHTWLLRERPDIYPKFTRWVFAWALLRYDIFHLYYDRGILSPPARMCISIVEMDALRASGKRLYTYAYGADVRTRAETLLLGEFNLCAECPKPGVYCQCDDQAGTENMQAISQYATAMISMGDMLAYVPNARNMHYWPVDTKRLLPSYITWHPGKRPLRIAHAPNHAHFKGTSFLESAVAKLQGEGIMVELVRVQGVPNEQVLELFRSADMVADQFIAGFHGYTALEAMALGKPVLCFLRGPDMAVNFSECPIINANPHTLYKVLKDCATGKYDLNDIGHRSRSYLEKHYSLEATAARLARLYLDTANFPRRWTSALGDLSKRLPPVHTNKPRHDTIS